MVIRYLVQGNTAFECSEIFPLQEGKGLLKEDHYAQADIKKRLEELELSWEALMAASAEKKDRLQDAYQVGVFPRQ